MSDDLTERLRMLHQKRRGELDQSDWICAGHGFMGYPPEWPCETVRLLDLIDSQAEVIDSQARRIEELETERASLSTQIDRVYGICHELHDERAEAHAERDAALATIGRLREARVSGASSVPVPDDHPVEWLRGRTIVELAFEEFPTPVRMGDTWSILADTEEVGDRGE